MTLEVGSIRKDQWNGYLGSTKDILVGEYNVFIISLEALRQRLVTDMTYIKQMDMGLLVLSYGGPL